MNCCTTLEVHSSFFKKTKQMIMFPTVFCFLYCFRDGQCKEHNEEQAVLAVGLARAKPGVFVEAIQYLLVLATPIEVFTALLLYK